MTRTFNVVMVQFSDNILKRLIKIKDYKEEKEYVPIYSKRKLFYGY